MIIKLIVIVVIILVLILLYVYFKYKKNFVNNKVYKYHQIRNKLKTGDIILFSCKEYENFIEELKYYARTTLLGSEYGHVGIIIKDNNKLYVLECISKEHAGNEYASHFNKKGDGGVRIIDLDILLKEYCNYHKGMYAVKFINQEIPNKIIFNKLKKYEDMTFEHKSIILTVAFIDICISHNLAVNISNFLSSKDKIFCSEFVHDLLNNCGVLKNYPSKLFWPHMIDNDQFKDFHNDYYSDLYQFTYN